MRNHLLVDALRRNVGVMFSFVGSIPNDQFLKQKLNNRFSIYDHVKKLSAVQDLYLERIEHYMTEPDPRIPEDDGDRHEPSREIDVPIHVLMRAFERLRNEQASLIESADDITWSKNASFFDGQKRDFGTFVRGILDNDRFHIDSMRELWILKEISTTTS